MIYTFYSYKGGVGRSMAMANVAEWLYQQGKRVVMIDWDLEAPGLEGYFFPEEQLDEIKSKPGLMDVIVDYKSRYTKWK
jgi:MinD-like ATPase involved in chromosome partitioning or flagellar assembly